MINPRFIAIRDTGVRTSKSASAKVPVTSSESFSAYVFNPSVMEKLLPKHIYQNIMDASAFKAEIMPDYADTIALAMKEWAVSHGATHYTHWFQPLTGASAEKHDAFLDWTSSGGVLEQFTGKQLIQGEPDASSFPSGGLRSTYEARGYTAWDPSSPVFLLKAGDGVTLCIPTVFFSWTGEVLDSKIPVLRSDEKLNQACLRLLKLTGIEAGRVYSTLGLEQEYFVIDRSFRNLRPDLLLLGKTVYGAMSPKGQELQDHYLGSVKDRILAFMLDFENEALKVGIPVKTRHNEVAPAQHEVAPVFEKSSKAIDHNILLMEIMRHVAVKHDLACLLHEKPFKNFNGSGKHSNWSLATDTGINLLDPTDIPGNNLHFLILLTAILSAIHKHAALIRASIGSASNDYRLGGHEAPPAIISVYLGEELEEILNQIETKGEQRNKSKKEIFNLGLPLITGIRKDNTDRNRSSPFAFTGNKFEFRAVGSSSNPAFPITVLNAIVAESLSQILDEIERSIKKTKTQSRENLAKVVIPLIRKYLKISKPIRYSGDNYSETWKREAKKRGLPNFEKSLDAFPSLTSEDTVKCFKGILNREELISRYEVFQENYLINLNIEIQLMLEMFDTQILPTCVEYQKNFANNLEALALQKLRSNKQRSHLKMLYQLIERAITEAEDLRNSYQSFKGALRQEVVKKVPIIISKMENLRKTVDQLELMVDDQIWPLPKYREMLFLI